MSGTKLPGEGTTKAPFARRLGGRAAPARGWSNPEGPRGILVKMSLAASKAGILPERLARFRQLRARLDPAGDPSSAFAKGLYVAAKDSVSQRLTAELTLAPSSTHLLVGGVGSGKTTELLSARRQLNELPDTFALYIDVSEQHDICKMVPGAILIQAGIALAEEFLSPEVLRPEGSVEGREPAERYLAKVQQRLKDLRAVAHGYWMDARDLDLNDDFARRHTHIKGVLEPPARFEENVGRIIDLIDNLLEPLANEWKHIVVFFDGLDRITDLASFERLIGQDVKALSSRGVGVVLVGPLRAQYGLDRAAMAQHFDDRIHYQPWIEPSDFKAGSFLVDVLRQRVPEGMMDDEALASLVVNSGGVLRDMLSLAQSACVETYMYGSDVIGVREVEAAVDAFGRKHMQGLRPAEIEVLRRVLERGTFVHTPEDELALLMTRRVLEYRHEGRPRYAVHPTIVRFLRESA
jgi:hypothetical protein